MSDVKLTVNGKVRTVSAAPDSIPSDLLERLRATGQAELAAAIERSAGPARSQLVVEHELTAQAVLATEDIIDDARAEEREIRLAAEDYADEILSTFEANLSKFIAAIQRGRERLHGPDEPAAIE